MLFNEKKATGQGASGKHGLKKRETIIRKWLIKKIGHF